MTTPHVDRMEYPARLLPEGGSRVEIVGKLLLLSLGLIGTRFLQTFRLHRLLLAGTLSYAALSLVFVLLLALGSRTVRRIARPIFSFSYATDILYASLVIYYSAEFGDEMYLLYALLALKSALYYPFWTRVLAFPFALGPLYAIVLRLSVGSWYFLTEPSFLLRYVVLFVVVLTAVYLGWLSDRSRRREGYLRRMLGDRTLELDNKTQATQQMAASLGNRVLELRTLQEGIKAINSALALEDVLRLIVANTSQVLQGARCSVTLLEDEHGQAMTMASMEWKPDALSNIGAKWNRDVAAGVVESRKPVLVQDAAADQRFKPTAGLPIASLISVPLFLGDRPIGALTATAPDKGAFSIEDSNLLGAFADQAVVAVSNARLYGQLVEEQKQTEQLYQHVQERRNELEAILRGIGDGVIVADPALNLLLMNPVATRIFGVKRDISASVSLAEVVPHQELIALFQDAIHGQPGAIVREISLPRPRDGEAPRGPQVSALPRPRDGETWPGAQGTERRGIRSTGTPSRSSGGGDGQDAAIYQALASPILGAGGKVRGCVTVLRDITSQKELEYMKSNFLSVVSHELKTPLHSIKGFVEIILMGKTGAINETQADFLTTVRDQTAHLQNLISDLLEFSRLESGQVKLRLTEVSMAEVAKAVMDKLKPMADQGQIQLLRKIDPEFSTIQADRVRMEQVLTNLVHNAIKFTAPSGTVSISAADLGSEIQIVVSDTGIGIPKSELDRIFDRFYQVDSGSTRHYRGTGLGLTICKHIVEYHRGRIWAESEEGKGARFYFILPKLISAEEDQLLLDFVRLPKKD